MNLLSSSWLAGRLRKFGCFADDLSPHKRRCGVLVLSNEDSTGDADVVCWKVSEVDCDDAPQDVVEQSQSL